MSNPRKRSRPTWVTTSSLPPCPLCRERPKPLLKFLCQTCEEHQARCAATARRVYAGRKVDRLSPAEERGKQMRAPQ